MKPHGDFLCCNRGTATPPAQPVPWASMLARHTGNLRQLVIFRMFRSLGDLMRSGPSGENELKVDGQCLCGDLKYEANVNPDTAHICSCTDCQVLSGSAFRTTVFVEDNSFVFLSGEPSTYIKIAASGRQRELGFCPRCGTSIFSRPVGAALGYFGLRIGSLRQRDLLDPKSHTWFKSAQPWINKISDLSMSDDE